MDDRTAYLVWVAVGTLSAVGPVLFSWWVGNWYQKRKQRQLVEREASFPKDPLSTLRKPFKPVQESKLVTANVLMSTSWWQGLIGVINMLIGGNISVWDKTLAWARQEAMQRLRETVREQGYDDVINLRMETTVINNSKGNKAAGVEILYYGTAVRYKSDVVNLTGTVS